MPLLERARIEVYVPDLAGLAHRGLLEAFEAEFLYAFGVATIVRGLSGSYLSTPGTRIEDTVSLIYTDAPFSFSNNFESISRYTDDLRGAASEALAAFGVPEEEAVWIVALPVYHSA